MHKITIYVAKIIVLVFGLVVTAHSAEPVKGYIYDGTGKVNNLSIVIDITTFRVEIQSVAGARVDGSIYGITHNYSDCSNEAFYCLTGLLEIVIPKAMPVKKWKYHDLSCRSVAQPSGDAYRITCRSPKYRGHPTYTYSLSRGVTSIESSPITGDYRYELRGEYGIFARN